MLNQFEFLNRDVTKEHDHFWFCESSVSYNVKPMLFELIQLWPYDRSP